jgi:hypothetical protein
MSTPPVATPPPRGVAYFCEETLQYIGGGRAWLFFGPYLLGAICLEPSPTGRSIHGISPWLVLLGYLVLFPPLWRAFLTATGLWRKRARKPSPQPARQDDSAHQQPAPDGA